MNLHSLSSIDYYNHHPLRQWDYPIEQFDQSLKKCTVLLLWDERVVCGCALSLSLFATVWQNTMQVVENGFAPSSDVWGPFGPLFVVKSGLHSITANGINSYLGCLFSASLYTFYQVTPHLERKFSYSATSNYFNSTTTKCKWKTLVNLLSTCQSPRCLPIYPHWANWRALCSRGGENNLQMRSDLTWGRSQTCH